MGYSNRASTRVGATEIYVQATPTKYYAAQTQVEAGWRCERFFAADGRH
jgi:hypothetical protein